MLRVLSALLSARLDRVVEDPCQVLVIESLLAVDRVRILRLGLLVYYYMAVGQGLARIESGLVEFPSSWLDLGKVGDNDCGTCSLRRWPLAQALEIPFCLTTRTTAW